MGDHRKPVDWLHGEIKSPPFSDAARKEMGVLLSRLQQGRLLSLPHSRPMPSIGTHCHELRVQDAGKTWRLIYNIHPERIFVLDVFQKQSRTTPQHVIDACRARLQRIQQSEWRSKHG